MKKALIFLLFGMLFMAIAPQIGITQDTATEVVVNNDLDLGDITEHPDPSDTPAFMKWWFAIVGLFNSWVIWLVAKIWPNRDPDQTRTRAVQIGLGVIVAVLLYVTGGSPEVGDIISGVVAFIIQGLQYDAVMKPMGMTTAKTYKSGSGK